MAPRGAPALSGICVCEYAEYRGHRPAFGRVALFVRVVGGHDEQYVPLTREEVAWLLALTNAETHTVEFSEGVIEGDEVKVTKGPLKGQEAKIVKVDRHKRLAWLEMHMFGRTKVVKVGLEIVSKS